MAEEYLVGTADVEALPASIRPGDYAKSILYYVDRHLTPFTAIMSTLKKREKAKDMKFWAYEQDIPKQQIYVNDADGLDADDTDIVVDDGAGTSGLARTMRKNILLRVGSNPASGEVVRVSADPASATTIVVERGFAGTTPDTIANNALLTVIGEASAEGEDSPTAYWAEPDEIFNYLQIFQHSWALTRVQTQILTRFAESEEMRHKMQAYGQHALAREAAFLYGERSRQVAPDADSRYRQTTGGIATFIDAGNVHDGSGANFTKANFKAWVEPLSNYGNPQEKLVLMGGTAKSALHSMIEYGATMVMEPFESKWGFRMSRLRTAGPDLVLMEHPWMTRYHPGEMLIVDLTALTFMFLDDFITQQVTLANNPNLVKSQFYSNCGLKAGIAKAHGRIYGITTFTKPA